MTRSSLLLLLAVVAVAVTGCTPATATATPDEVQAWMDDVDLDDDDALATFIGGVSPEFAADSGIRSDFESALAVDGVDVTCFGQERMSVEVRIHAATEATTVREDDLPCDGRAHRIDVSLTAVQSVGVDAVGVSDIGAWAAVVRAADR